MDVNEAKALLDIPKYLQNARYDEWKWDKEYDPNTDTFHSSKRKGRKHFERFYYLKYPINGKMILFNVGRTSDRYYDGGVNNEKRILDENGNPIYHYYLHSIKHEEDK